MAMNLGVPLKLLNDFLNRKITVETIFGDVFVGELIIAQENMSVSLNKVNATLNGGKTVAMKNVYVKGSSIRLISFPEAAAKESLRRLTKPPSFRGSGRGGSFRGGRGGSSGGRHSSKPSYDRHRY